MPMKQDELKALVKEQLLPAFKHEHDRLEKIDKWYRWEHDRPKMPRHSTKEYKELAERSQTPWLGLVVTSAAQNLYVDGYRAEGKRENSEPWTWWLANGMDARQSALHRGALAYGHAYTTVLPGENELTEEKMPAIRCVSPKRMITFYNEPEHDDFPRYALRADPTKLKGSKKTNGYVLKVYDDECVYRLQCATGGDSLEFITFDRHDMGVCPVVRYTNRMDLEGRTPGEVEPFIPIAARIDQTVFDRLVVQRFGSWVVRTVTGLSQPEDMSDEEFRQLRLSLKVGDFLVGEDPDTRFGSIPASTTDGYIKGAEADIQALAAVTQTPAHELLGTVANLSAEALAAARAQLTARVEENKYGLGAAHKLTFRLAARAAGNEEGARDFTSDIKWRDTEIRSLAQAADALGKIAKMLNVPVQALWEKIPGWTQTDVEHARKLAEEGGAFTELEKLLNRQADVDDDEGS